MVADLNVNGPKTMQFIHIVADTDFTINEILCYENKRIFLDEFDSFSQLPYIQEENGYIPYGSSC